MAHEPIRLEIGVRTPSDKMPGDVVWLAYELLEGSFPRQWLAASLHELERRKLWGCRFGALCVDEVDYRLRIQRSFERFQSNFPKENSALNQIGFQAVPFIPRKQLESLLQVCMSTASKQASELADLIRHYIQIYHPEYHYHVSFKSFVPHIFEIPNEADKLFTVDRHDGWIYLEYEGEGLDAIASYDEQNSTDCEPQTRFSNGFQLLYRDEFDGAELDSKIRSWLSQTLSSRPQAQRPNVGLIPLAKPIHKLHRHVVRDLFSSAAVEIQFRASYGGRVLKQHSDLSEEFETLKPWHSWGPTGILLNTILRKTYLDVPVGFYLDGYHRFEGPLWFIKRPLQPLIFYWRYQIRTGFFDYRQYLRLLAYRMAKPFFPAYFYLRHQFSNGFLDARIMTKVYLGRFWTALVTIWIAMVKPIHWARPHAFNLYFTVSKPIRKVYYFVSFQFQKRILRRGDKP